MTRPPMLAADMIRELTRPFTTSTPILQPVQGDDGRWRTTTRLHTVTHESLLDQLRGAAGDSSSRSDSDAARGAVGSKPAAHLEALDTLARINQQSKARAATLGLHPVETNLELRLLAISGRIGGDLDKEVRSWWAAARLVTHWDTPAHRPHGAPCPECWDVDTLRIRLDDELAVCTGCGEVWDRTGDPGHRSLDILGQHVRWCTDHEVTKPRHWSVTADGFPIECVECLAFREAWAEWRRAHPSTTTKGALTA